MKTKSVGKRLKELRFAADYVRNQPYSHSAGEEVDKQSIRRTVIYV